MRPHVSSFFLAKSEDKGNLTVFEKSGKKSHFGFRLTKSADYKSNANQNWRENSNT